LDEARRHADAGRLALARDTVEKALAVNKLDASLHHLHAAVLQELGCDVQARQAWRRALYIDTGFVLAHHGLGMLALRQGQRSEARHHLQNVLVLLARYDAQALLPHSGGLAAGHLRAMTETALARMAA
jgi:chemotaxis protein methyltransferase CheR